VLLITAGGPAGQLLAGQRELPGFGQIVLCADAARRWPGAGHREPRPVFHGAPFDVRLPLPDQPVSALAGQVAVQAVEVPVNDDLHGQLPLVLTRLAEAAQQFLPPGFQLVDQRFLLLGRLDQRRLLRSVGRLVVPIADTPPQAGGRLRGRVRSSSTSLSSSASASVLMAGCLLPPAALPPAALPLAVEAGTEAAPPSGTRLA
jgi:hypothetical protein